MAKTFFEFMQPTLWVTNILGYTYITAREGRGIFRRLLEHILSFPFFALSVSIICKLATVDSTHDKRVYLLAELTKVSDTIAIVTGALGLVVKDTYYYVNRNTVKNLILQMEELDENELIKRIYPNKYKSLSSVLISALALFFANFLVFKPSLDFNSTEIYFYCTYTIGIFSSFVETFLIAQLTNNMQIKYTNLNKQLQSIKPRDFRRIFSTQRAEVIEKLEKEAIQFAAARINEIVATHYHLTTTSKQLNDIFAIPILVLVIIDFQAITSSLYVFLKLSSNAETSSNFVESLFAVSWPFIIFSEIVIISKSFDSLAEKANQTADYIHEIWNIQKEKDKRITATLQIASVKLLHTKISFSIRGLFPLDVVAGVTTYLVVWAHMDRLT